MSKQKHSYLLPILALVIAQILWGINTPVIKLGLKTVPLAAFMEATASSRVQAPPTVMVAAEAFAGDSRVIRAKDNTVATTDITIVVNWVC